jgi:hypothetical protein
MGLPLYMRFVTDQNINTQRILVYHTPQQLNILNHSDTLGDSLQTNQLQMVRRQPEKSFQNICQGTVSNHFH